MNLTPLVGMVPPSRDSHGNEGLTFLGCADTYIHTYIHTYTHTYSHVYAYSHAQIHTYTNTYIHTHMHEHACKNEFKHTSLRTQQPTLEHRVEVDFEDILVVEPQLKAEADPVGKYTISHYNSLIS